MAEDSALRAEQWTVALEQGGLPPFVTERLKAAAAGTVPWMATMTAAELLIAKSHGIRPLATVSGTCWFHYGWSWTEGHAQGWHEALDRIRREALACGANAVVDVRMRTLRHKVGASMDFTLVGTAVRLDRLPPSREPVIATVPALEFVRLLEMGIVPTGIAVGARYDWLYGSYNSEGATFTNQPLAELGNFWESIRRAAHADLRRAVAKQGNGVLAHTHFGQILKRERDKAPPAYLGRHIVVGTVVDTRRGEGISHPITMMLDMRGRDTVLKAGAGAAHDIYAHDLQDEEGAI